jgi:hypothetical protein
MDTKKALELLEMTIDEAENLRTSSYENGKDFVDGIDAKIKHILEISYDDVDEKLTEYDNEGINSSQARSASPEVLEAEYQNRILRFLLRLHSMKEELELLRSIQTSEAKLDKIEADIQKAKKESDRRGVFIEGAFYDAFIEIVERLREELRGRSDNSKEIAKIKKEIAELRKVVMLNADDLHVDTANLQAMKQPNDE